MKEYTQQAKRFYRSKEWREIREIYLQSVHYLCERCGKPADVVHHKVHIDSSNINNMDILLGFDNLEALCLNCHNKEHFSKDEKTISFDANGDPIF